MKRLIALILCAMMLAPTFASCSEKSQDGGETAASTENSANPGTAETDIPEEELTDLQKRQMIPDDLPDQTFNGEEFRVLTNADGYS